MEKLVDPRSKYLKIDFRWQGQFWQNLFAFLIPAIEIQYRWTQIELPEEVSKKKLPLVEEATFF
jgi:hypothetical protein